VGLTTLCSLKKSSLQELPHCSLVKKILVFLFLSQETSERCCCSFPFLGAWCCCCQGVPEWCHSSISTPAWGAPLSARPQPEHILHIRAKPEHATVCHRWEPEVGNPQIGSSPSPVLINGLVGSHHPPELFCSIENGEEREYGGKEPLSLTPLFLPGLQELLECPSAPLSLSLIFRWSIYQIWLSTVPQWIISDGSYFRSCMFSWRFKDAHIWRR
jgi:hypothetical protein